MESLRVLIACGPAAGGIRRHVEALFQELPRRGCEVALAGPAEMGPGARWFPVAVGDRPRPLSDLAAGRALRAAVREWRPDVVHLHGVKMALLGLAAPLPGAPPALVTFHNLWKGGPLTPLVRLLAPRAAGAVTVSGAVRDSLEKHGIRLPRAVVVPNGVDVTRFQLSPLPGGPFTAAFLGRLTEEKGAAVLLEALPRLARWMEPGTLLAAGDGPLRARVEEAAERPGSPLRYLGFQDDVVPVYRRSRAALIPSLSEGQGLAALEAMACGRPVVAASVGGLREVVLENETGLLVPPGDAGALADALRAIAADPSGADRMGAAGRKRVEALFTREEMLERLLRLYRGLVS